MLRKKRTKRTKGTKRKQESLPPEPSTTERGRQESGFIPLAQNRPGLPNIVSDALDLAQDGQPALSEKLDVYSKIRAHPLHQRHPALEKVSGSLHLKTHQLNESRREASVFQVGVGITEMPPVFLGQINTINVKITGHVLPKISELKGG